MQHRTRTSWTLKVQILNLELQNQQLTMKSSVIDQNFLSLISFFWFFFCMVWHKFVEQKMHIEIWSSDSTILYYGVDITFCCLMCSRRWNKWFCSCVMLTLCLPPVSSISNGFLTIIWFFYNYVFGRTLILFLILNSCVWLPLLIYYDDICRRWL